LEKHVFLFALVITLAIAGTVYYLKPSVNVIPVEDSTEQRFPIPQQPQTGSRVIPQSNSIPPRRVTGSEVYKWVDENGVSNYSDRPVVETAEVVELKPLSKMSIPRAEQNRIDAQRRREVANYLSQSSQPQQITKVAARRSSEYVLERASVDQLSNRIRFSGRFSGGPECRRLAISISAKSNRGKTISAQTYENNVGGDFGSWLFEAERKHNWNGKTPKDFWEVTGVNLRCLELK